jgi:hypothetical protein
MQIKHILWHLDLIPKRRTCAITQSRENHMEVVEDSRRKEMASLDWSCQDGAIMNLESNFSRFELFPADGPIPDSPFFFVPSALP